MWHLFEWLLNFASKADFFFVPHYTACHLNVETFTEARLLNPPHVPQQTGTRESTSVDIVPRHNLMSFSRAAVLQAGIKFRLLLFAHIVPRLSFPR